jgi:hypothetical protein
MSAYFVYKQGIRLKLVSSILKTITGGFIAYLVLFLELSGNIETLLIRIVLGSIIYITVIFLFNIFSQGEREIILGFLLRSLKNKNRITSHIKH